MFQFVWLFLHTLDCLSHACALGNGEEKCCHLQWWFWMPEQFTFDIPFYELHLLHLNRTRHIRASTTTFPAPPGTVVHDTFLGLEMLLCPSSCCAQVAGAALCSCFPLKKHFCRQSPLIQQVNLQVWDLPAPQVTTHTINVAHSKNITNCVNWYGNLKSSFIHSIAVLPFNNSMLHSCNMRSRLGCCNISFIRGLGGQRSCSSSAIQMLVFAMKKIWRRDVT